MGYMPDGNSAALARYERDQARGERAMDEAQAERAELVKDFIYSTKHESDVLSTLADLAGGDAEFLHALQRGDAVRMMKLLRDAVDKYHGDDLVDERAHEIQFPS